MFRVETYSDPVKFFNTIKIEPDELHITSIPTLAMHLKDMARKINGRYIWNIWIYHHFYRALYSNWSNTKSKLKQKQVLRRLINNNSFEGIQIKAILLKQIDDLCETFRLWHEMGLKDIKSEKLDGNFEKAYIALYNDFLADSELENINLDLDRHFSSEQLSKHLSRYNEFHHHIEHLEYTGIKRIYVYCMEFLEPSRVTFFKKMQSEGYEVIFRIPNSKEYPQIHECWQNLYTLLVPKDQWQVIQGEEGETSTFKAFIEGKQITIMPKRKIIYHEINEPVLFKQYLKQYPMSKDQREYVACCDDKLNEYFRDEIGQKKGLKHFFDTPLGKFINALYNSRLQGENDVVMDYFTFIDMMTSGIVTIKRSGEALISGKRSLGVLSDLVDYMDGVRSLNEIIERLEDYKILNNMSDEFEDLSKSKCDRNRVKRYLQNPLRSIGYVNQNKYSVTANQLYELSLKLKEMIHMLIVENSPVYNFDEHIKYLEGYVNESKLREEVDDQEVELAYRQFFKLLESRFYDAEIDDIKDMNDYIALRNKIPSMAEDNGDIVLIKGLEHIPALAVNGVKEVYLCDLSTKSMNEYINRRGKIGNLVNLKDLRQFIERYDEQVIKADLINTIDLTERSISEIQNFIKYNLAMLVSSYKGVLHIGWIKNMEAYDTEWYLLNTLKGLCDVEEKIVKVEIDESIFKSLKNQEKIECSIPIEQIQKQLSPLAWHDLDVCDKRFYLGNILNHYPTYIEDFQLRELFAQLARLLEDQHGGREAVIQNFYPLFPQWNNAVKQNLVDTSIKRKMGQYVAFENIHFPEDMQSIHYLNANHETIKTMKNRLTQDKTKKLEEWLQNNASELRANPSKRCSFCSYQLICKEGGLGIEQNS